MNRVSRLSFVGKAAIVGALPAFSPAAAFGEPQAAVSTSPLDEQIRNERIRRAILSGPTVITKDATVAELDRQGNMTVVRRGTNEWVCVPGNQDIIGRTDMCIDPMGMLWLKDLMARKPKPTNAAPGLIYMLNGATQHSFTDPFDTTSPAIPIGPHWMILCLSMQRRRGFRPLCGMPGPW